MADTKATDLNENTDPQTTDIVYIVDDPGGSPASEKITLANLKALINDLATAAIWDAAGDLLYGTGANTGARLPVGSAKALLRVNAGATAPEWVGALTDWTPTVTQSGSVSRTVDYAKYAYIGPLLYLCASISITGAGTGANDIKIGGLPANPAANGSYGTAWINDNGTAFYTGALLYIEAGVLKCRAHLEGDDVGSDPNFALASGDAILLFAMYPPA